MTKKKIKWLGLAALTPAMALIFLDQTILPVALPTIQKDFAASFVSLEWCINIYILTLAVFVLVGGKIADRIGYRSSFLIALTLFAAASLLCGLSPNIGFLIASRGLQGLGAAFLFPASTGVISSLFEPRERGKAIGINVSIGSLFLIMGPLVGGYFTQALSWRWIFWINLPLSAIGILLFLLMIPKIEAHKQKIDVWGFLAFVFSSSPFVLFLMQGREWGWLSWQSLSLLALTLISGFLLIWREKKAEHPFLDLSLFKHPVYLASNISMAMTQFLVMSTVFWSIYFQQTLSYSPMEAGTITFLSCIPVLVCAPLCGMLSDRISPKLPIAMGFLLLIFSFIWFAFFSQSSIGWLLVGLLCFGAGIPFILTPASSSAMNAVPPTKMGSAGGMMATARFLSGSFGVALLGTFLNGATSRFFQKELSQGLDPSQFQTLLEGGDPAHTSLQNLSSEQGEMVLGLVKQAQLHGFFTLNMFMAFLTLVAFAIVFVFFHRHSTHKLPPAPAEGWD